MYSSIQQQCLKQLGISIYQLRDGLAVANNSPNEYLEWSSVSQGFITDIKKLFPLSELTDKQMKLTDDVIWLLSHDTKIVLSDNVLHSPMPSNMSVSQLRELWLLLAELEGVVVSD